MKVVCLTLTVVLMYAQASPELELRAAMHKEQVQGDLKGAIAAYQKIIQRHGKNRAMVAKALFQMAECHQKLGDSGSRKIYERIVQEYPDQNETAVAARVRLGASSATLNMRSVMTTSGKGVDLENVTPDGRLACGADRSNGDLLIRDMSTGEVKRILPGSLETRTLGAGAGIGSYVASCVISPDQKQVAFTRHLPEENYTHQLWVISTEPGAKPRQVTHNPGIDKVHSQGWSPDGKYVFAKIQCVEEVRDQIVRISIADGSMNVVKTFAPQQYLDVWLKPSPDGRFIAYSAAPSPASRDRNIYAVAADGSNDSLLVSTAGINEQPVWTPDGSRILFTSDRTGTFDLWSVGVRGGKVAGEPSLVVRNIGQIKNIGMTRSGTYFFMSKGTVERAAVAQLKPSIRMLEGFAGIRPTLSPDGKYAAFVRRQPSSQTTLDVVLRSLETGEERIFSRDGISGVVGWFPDGKGIITAVTNERTYHEKEYYRVSIPSGQSQKIWEYDPYRFGGRMAAISSDNRTMYAAGRESWESWQYLVGYFPTDYFPLNRVMKVDPITGKQSLIFTLPEAVNIVDSFQLSPDGQTLAVIVEDRSPDNNSSQGRKLITVATNGSGSRELYKDHRQTLSAVAWNDDSRTLFFGKRDANNTWQIMSVPASGGALSATGLSMQGRYISVSTNGSRMVLGGLIDVDEMWALDNVLGVLK